MNLLYTVFLLSGIFHANTQDGVFLSSQSYVMQEVWVADQKNTQRLVERNDGVRLVSSSCSQLFTSKNAYGYRKGNKAFRFWGKNCFEIINIEGIFIYRLEVDSQSSSELYYFSKTANDDLLPMNRKNLKEVYKNEHPVFAESVSLLDWYICLTDSIAPLGKLRIVELFQYCTK